MKKLTEEQLQARRTQQAQFRKTAVGREVERRKTASLRQRHPYLARLIYIRRKCKERNLDFNLDEEYLKTIQTPICPVLNILLNYDLKGAGKGLVDQNAAHLDRIDMNKGYVKGNVAFISLRANKIKNNATLHELEKIVEYIKCYGDRGGMVNTGDCESPAKA